MAIHHPGEPAGDRSGRVRKIDLIRDDLSRVNLGANQTMATISKDSLLTAVVTFRDSLPEDHNRRCRLAKVSNLRFDTKDPTICYLIESSGEELARRLDLTQPVEKVAEAAVLYPAHSALEMMVSPEDASRIAAMKQSQASNFTMSSGIAATLIMPNPLSLAIREVFVTETPGFVIIHIEEGVQSAKVVQAINDRLESQADESKYIATKLILAVCQAMSAASHQGTGMSFGIELDRSFMWQVQLLSLENGERLVKMKQAVDDRLEDLKKEFKSNVPKSKDLGVTDESADEMVHWIRDSLSEMFPDIWPRAADSRVHAERVDGPEAFPKPDSESEPESEPSLPNVGALTIDPTVTMDTTLEP